MRILILGINGFLGQYVYNASKNKNIKVYGTTRYLYNKKNNPHKKNEVFYEIDFNNSYGLEKIKNIVVLNNITVIINCIKDTSGNSKSIFDLNVTLPKQLDTIGIHIISFSSDSVVEKNKNAYIKSKQQLESTLFNNTLLIRTTFWGYDFLSNRGLINKLFDPIYIKLDGYSNYLFSGLYVGLLSNIIIDLAKEKKLGHINIFSNSAISKLNLLLLVNKKFNTNKIINAKELNNNINYSIKSDIAITQTYKEQINLFYQDYKTHNTNSILLCRQCNSPKIKEVFDFGLMPLAGNFLKKEDLSNDIKYTMSLSLCDECKILQINESIKPSILFKDYRYSSSTIQALISHFTQYAKDLKKDFSNYKMVLEIGCNDGVLLTPLSNIGFNVLGIEPATNIAKKAKAKGHNVINDFFSMTVAKVIIKQYGKFDIITANNVLAHIENISDIFNAIKYSLSKKGFLVFEVQYLKALVDKFQYDFIYHEHIFYYSITAINNILQNRNMKITQIIENNIHGGTIRIYATHNNNNIPNNHLNNLNDYLIKEEKNGLTTLNGMNTFFNKVIQHKKQTILFLDKLKNNKNITIACYGASGRSVTYLNYCGINQNYISFFIDDSLERSGRYIPGLQIPIITLNQLKEQKIQPDYIIITAWTFKNDIIKKLDWYENKGGVIIIPFPNITYHNKSLRKPLLKI